MQALSVQQPWAWLIVNGYKDVENRSWPCPSRYFGETLVHAGKKFDKEGYEWVKQAFPEVPLPEPSAFERGGIVGRVVIVTCVTHPCSPWFFGPYGFTLASAKPLPFQPCRGQLGFFQAETVRPVAADCKMNPGEGGCRACHPCVAEAVRP